MTQNTDREPLRMVSLAELMADRKSGKLKEPEAMIYRAGAYETGSGLCQRGGTAALCGADRPGCSWIMARLVRAVAMARALEEPFAESCGLKLRAGSACVLPYGPNSAEDYARRLGVICGGAGEPLELLTLAENPPALMARESRDGPLEKTADWESVFDSVRDAAPDYLVIDAAHYAADILPLERYCLKFLDALREEAEAGDFSVLLVSPEDAYLYGDYWSGVHSFLCLEDAADGGDGRRLRCDKAKYAAGRWSVELEPLQSPEGEPLGWDTQGVNQ